MTDAADRAGLSGADVEKLEAAAFRRLLAHLRERTDVQNIDMMNLSGFCRNCLSRWFQEEAEALGHSAVTKDLAREIVYGMPYEAWREAHQTEASGAQLAAFKDSSAAHGAKEE